MRAALMILTALAISSGSPTVFARPGTAGCKNDQGRRSAVGSAGHGFFTVTPLF